tara:strand:+ start:905 stop:1774 length:870 start_codon:yes stop_codon:yes gene_type:complete
MTSLRPIGKSIENDEIQNLFVESLKNLNIEMTLSLTQFDDQGVQEYIYKQNIKNYFVNFEKKKLPIGTKYSNKIMLENAIDQYLKDDFEYFVYSTADILVPKTIFQSIEKIKTKVGISKDFCALIYPNILKKNQIIKSETTPHYGIDLFVFKISKNKILKLKEAIKSWDQFDWGINDNFYVSVCEMLDLPIYNIYRDNKLIKIENDFKTIKEDRTWQTASWKKNQKFFINFLRENNLPLLYAYGSYYYLLIKIFRFSDFNFNLFIVYFKFYIKTPLQLIKKVLNILSKK